MDILAVIALSALIADAIAGLMNGGKVKLIKADFALAPTLVAADLTFADFDGYGDITPCTWASGTDAEGNHVATASTQLQWQAGPDPLAITNTIYGVAMTDAADVLLAVAKLTNAVDVVHGLQLLEVTLGYTVETNEWSGVVYQP